MDWFTQGLVTGIAANVLTNFVPQLCDLNTELTLLKLDAPIPPDDKLASLLSATVEEASKGNGLSKTIVEFLHSPETESILRQLFSTRIAEPTRDLASIKAEFIAALGSKENTPTPQHVTLGTRLFEAVLRGCDLVLTQAISNGLLTAHEAKSTLRNQLLLDHISLIEANLDLLLKRTDLNVANILAFESSYRARVERHFKFITPPDIEATQEVLIDKIYVTPKLKKFTRKKSADDHTTIAVSEFTATAYRGVILGNPGGGKTTFVRKITHDLSLADHRSTFGGRRLTPLFVVLREFGIDRKHTPCSIAEYISLKARVDFQLTPPPHAFEYLLLNGRAMVIFDGLDELLDTRDRLDIKKAVEHFADLYPAVPILVTSREIGYEQAPLDPETFVKYSLAPFDEAQVSSYAVNWFNCISSYLFAEREKLTQAFIRESRIVPDLRSNPLMLALMCNIYRQDGYIPSNRPDVYKKCAELLFVKWDKKRGIHYPLPFEHHLRPAITHIAHWIYSTPKLQSGVDEMTLIDEATRYLNKWCYDDEHEARAAAEQFIEFCRGRAWVLSDTGTRRAGDTLYQFTHRTFLEFFTAEFLVQTHRTPADLLKLLLPRVAKQEWDVVAQLSFQMKGSSFQGAEDELLSGVMQRARQRPSLKEKWNLISFMVRCLEFMVPTPELRSEICTLCIEESVQYGETLRFDAPFEPGGDQGAEGAIGALLKVSQDNRSVVKKCLHEKLVEIIKAGPEKRAIIGAVIAADLRYANLRGGPDENMGDEISRGIVKECSAEFRTLSATSDLIAFLSYYADVITLGEFASLRGIGGLFGSVYDPVYKFIRSGVAGNLAFRLTSLSEGTERDRDEIRKLGELCLEEEAPWMDRVRVVDSSFSSFPRHFQGSATGWEPKKNDPNVVFGVFAVFAVYLEAEQMSKKRIVDFLHVNPVMASFQVVFSSRFISTAPLDVIMEVLDKLNLSQRQMFLIGKWARREVNFVM